MSTDWHVTLAAASEPERAVAQIADGDGEAGVVPGRREADDLDEPVRTGADAEDRFARALERGVDDLHRAVGAGGTTHVHGARRRDERGVLDDEHTAPRPYPLEGRRSSTTLEPGFSTNASPIEPPAVAICAAVLTTSPPLRTVRAPEPARPTSSALLASRRAPTPFTSTTPVAGDELPDDDRVGEDLATPRVRRAVTAVADVELSRQRPAGARRHPHDAGARERGRDGTIGAHEPAAVERERRVGAGGAADGRRLGPSSHVSS